MTKAEDLNTEKTNYYYYIKGCFFSKKCEYGNALEMYEKISNTDPIFKEALYYLVEAYRKQDQLDKALKVSNQAVNKFSNNYKNYSIRGNVLADMNKHNEAILDYKKAIELNPNAKEAKYNIIWEYCKLNDYDMTMQLYNRYLKEFEYESKHLQYKAKLLRNFGKFDEAMEIISEILIREPFNPRYQRDKVICYYYQNKYNECIAEGEFFVNSEKPEISKEMEQLIFYIAMSYKKRDNNYKKYNYYMLLFEKAVPQG